MIRGFLEVARIGSLNWLLRPLTVATKGAFAAFLWNLIKKDSGNVRQNYLQSLLKGALTLVLLRYMKRSGISQLSPIPIIGALLLTLIGSKNGRDDHDLRGKKNQIIDIDEFTVIDKER
ncbi:MAG: hypothetical protein NTW84_04245 [Methanothrix sp.]|nr:hypothetical protein [Methanothrix sp.]